MDIIISNASGVPIYEQIVRQIKGAILSGQVSEGEALPSIRLLARDLRISVITTKRAYEELERSGFVTTVPGKGCFVAHQDQETRKEAVLCRVEEHLTKAVEEARVGAVSLAEMEEMLQTQGIDPFTQSAAYYRLTGDAPKANTVEVSVQNASRDAVYAPASMEKVTDGDVYERRNALLKGRGLFGTRNYTVTEVSGTRPSELMVAESWVSSPQTEEQTAYAQAESVYRSFVYDAYTAADEELLPVLNRLFWQDYDDENDGVYSALSRIREVLKAQVRYSETAEAAPDNANPIAYFLTDSRKGNAVLYAAATVQALRAHGIPARYAEGRRRRMSIEERVRQSQKLMFKLISLWDIDAALGWETSATDKALADTLPSVKPGEYECVNGLLEKTIYGGIALEPFEERALDLFVQRLWGRNVKKSWKMRLKLRYACLLAAK